MSVKFVHLHLHTEFSLVDSLIRPKGLVKSIVESGMSAVAVTDQSNLCVLVKFYNAATGAGVKPIFGSDVWVERVPGSGDLFRLVLLAATDEGYRNLTELLSLGYQRGQQQGKAVLQRQWLEEAHEGLIILSGGRDGDVGLALVSENYAEAEQQLRHWQSIFGDRFYLELIRTGRENEENYLHAAVELASKCDCPVVATNDVRFLKAEDFEVHDTRVCIGEGRALDDPRRQKNYSEQQYLRTEEEMCELFSDIPEALENSVEIAKRCNVTLRLGEYFLPDYPVPEGKTMDQFFREFSYEGLEERLAVILDKNDPDYDAKRKEYIDRLDFELDIILQMGFPGYFLIVMDFIQWAKNNDVPVGPGRGSGAGSLVAYVQKITDIDPLKYDLLFERFLNPERVSMPDFDVDFCMEGRDRVIDYVANHYGRDAVSQIITFGTMAAKAVVRDVARAQGKPYGLADRLSKMIPFEVGMTLEKAFEQEEPLRDFLATDSEAEEIWEMALRLEGTTRNIGKHAGGVVIAPTKLTDFSPLYCDETGAGLVTQFDKDDVESAGLVKFDFLGLRTLTIVDWALKTINAKRAINNEEPLFIEDIDLADKASFELLKRAETTAVFQLESRGMKDLIKRLLPDSFEDIIALVALFRPGPLQSGMVDDFINRKHGRAEVAYPHPDYQHIDLKPVLEPTYGIILYQEQVMQIAQVMAKYSLGGADLLRRAMGKKKPEVMAEQRLIFMEGALKNNVGEDLAGNIFDLMEKFAGYGFNKSHSAAYALVSFQTLWLKTHYPSEFMAAVLSADMHNTDKVVTLVEECRDMKLKVISPCVNVSEYKFTVDEANSVVYGLGAIKGAGEGPIDAIVDARNDGGPFKDIFDFCERVDSRKVNKRVLDALIRSGAFDNIAPHRAAMLACIEEAVKAAEQSAANASQGMTDLFGNVVPDQENGDVYANFLNVRELSDKERLQGEKDTLGLYLTGHPFDQYEQEVRRFARNRIVDLKPERKTQLAAGLVVAMRVMRTKRGDKMGFVTLDDRSGRIEVAFFSDVYDQFQHLLVKDNLLIIEGEVSHDDFSGSLKMRAKGVSDINQARLSHVKNLSITLREESWNKKTIEHLAQMIQPYCKGNPEDGCPMVIRYYRSDVVGDIKLGSKWRVEPKDELVHLLINEYGKKQVEIGYE